MKPRLGRGAAIAAGCVAVSLFFLLCLVFYGKTDYLSPERILARGDSLRFRIATALVEPLGAGAFLGLGLLFLWSVVAWFRDGVKGPVLPKIVGAAACIPAFCALTSLASDPREFWAGSVGIWMGDVVYRGFGPVLGWTVVGCLFLVSFALATEFGFHAQWTALRGSLSFPLLPPEAGTSEAEGSAAVAVLEPPPAVTVPDYLPEDLAPPAPPAPPAEDASDARLVDRDEHLADVRRRMEAGEEVSAAERAMAVDATDRNEMAAAIDAMFENAFAGESPAAGPAQAVVEAAPAVDAGGAGSAATETPAIAPSSQAGFELPEVPPFLADPSSGHPLLDQVFMVDGPTLDPSLPAPAPAGEAPSAEPPAGHARVIDPADIVAATKETEEFPVVASREVLPEFVTAPARDIFSGVEFLPPSDELAEPGGAVEVPAEPVGDPEPVVEAGGASSAATAAGCAATETPAPASVSLPSEVPAPEPVPADFEDEFFSYGLEEEAPAAGSAEAAVDPTPSVDAGGASSAATEAPVEDAPADANWLAIAAQDLGLIPVAEEEPAAPPPPPVDEAHEALARLFGDPVIREESNPGGPAQSDPREPPANLMPVLPVTSERVTLISDPVVAEAPKEREVVVDVDEQVHLPPPAVVVEDVPAPPTPDAESGTAEDLPSLDDEQAAAAIVDSLRDIFGDLSGEPGTPQEPTSPPATEKEPPALGAHGWGTLFPAMIEGAETASKSPTHAPPPEEPAEILSEGVDAPPSDEETPKVDAALVNSLVEGLKADAPAEPPAEEPEAAPPPPVVLPEPPEESSVPGARDELYEQAIEAVRERGRGSVVVLQRKLGIGFTRATKILAQLVEAGVLGPENSSGSHPLL